MPAKDVLPPNDLTPAERAELVESCRHFATKIARMYRGRGLSFDELQAAALAGLDKAARHFEPARGLRFTTYAYHWVKQRILADIRQQARFGIRMIPTGGRVRRIGQSRHASDSAPAPHELILAKTRPPGEDMDRDVIWDQCMKVLPPRLRDIAVLRYREGLTLEETGAALGVTRERIRQQEERLLARLKRAVVRGEVKVA